MNQKHEHVTYLHVVQYTLRGCSVRIHRTTHTPTSARMNDDTDRCADHTAVSADVLPSLNGLRAQLYEHDHDVEPEVDADTVWP